MKARLQSVSLSLMLLLTLLSGCSASRRVQRIVTKHPELLEVQAHAIDTLISVPVITDSIRVPIAVLLTADTVTIPAEHGTFTLSVQVTPTHKDLSPQPDLAITYQTDTTSIHYTDTIHYAQVVIEQPPPTSGRRWLYLTISILVIALFLYLFFTIKPKHRRR